MQRRVKLILAMAGLWLLSGMATSCATFQSSPKGQTWVPKHEKAKKNMRKYNNKRKF